MSQRITISDLSELEQLEAHAQTNLEEARRLRAESIPSLRDATAKRENAERRLEACKRLVTEWQEIIASFKASEGGYINVLAGAESVEASATRTIALIRAMGEEQNLHE